MAGKPLVHIGYPQTGTTWFQEIVFDNVAMGLISPLSAHQMTRTIVVPNDLDYRQADSRALFDQALMTAQAQERIPVFSLERFSGHPHSGGYDSKLIATRLRAVIDDARVLIVLREQKAAILSCYNQYIRRDGAISLRAYLSINDRSRIPLFDFAHFKYHRLIQLYFELFSRDNVLVLPYELFVAQPQGFTARILAHTGVTEIDAKLARLAFGKRVNVSLTPLEVEFRRRVNFLFGRRSPVNQSSPLPRVSRYTEKLFKVVKGIDRFVPASYERHTKQKWNQLIARMVGDTYRESNRITSELIQQDLGKWGYDM